MRKHRLAAAGSSPPPAAIDGSSCYSPFDSSSASPSPSSSSPSPSPSPSSSSSSSSSDEEVDTAMVTAVPAASFPWGTLEDLLLASAVLKHGTGNWTDVSGELQSRHATDSSALFSAEACKCRFLALSGRFAHCCRSNCREDEVPWFEELRKLRVAQLRRELEHYEGTIGSLERKLKRLKADTSQNTGKVASGKDSVDNCCHSQDFQDKQDPTLNSSCLAGTGADRETVLDAENSDQSIAAGVMESLVGVLNGGSNAQSSGSEQPAQSVIADCSSVQAGAGLSPGGLAIPAAQLATTSVPECSGLSVQAAPETSPEGVVKKQALDVDDSLQNINKVEAVKTGTDTPHESISLGEIETMAAPRGAASTQPESTSLGYCPSNLKEESPARCKEQATAASSEGSKGILVDYSKNGVNGIDLLRLAYGSVQDGSTPVSSPEMVVNEQQDPDLGVDMRVKEPYSEVKNSGIDPAFDCNVHRSYDTTSTVASDCDTTGKEQIAVKSSEDSKDEVVSGHVTCALNPEKKGIIECGAQLSLDSGDREGMDTETHCHVALQNSSQNHVSTSLHLPSQQEKHLQSASSQPFGIKSTSPKAVVSQVLCSEAEIFSAAVDVIPRTNSDPKQVLQGNSQECQKIELVSISEMTIVKDCLDEAAAVPVTKDVMKVALCNDLTCLHEADRACPGGFGDKQTKQPNRTQRGKSVVAAGFQSDLDAGADLIHNPPSFSCDALLPMAATTKDICIAAELSMLPAIVKSTPAVDACEDDGLLLDIIKLRGTELSSLRKRRRSSKADNLSGQGKNNLKESPAEMVARKQLKLENSSTEETGETPSTGNGKHFTKEDHNLIEKEKEACRSSQNSKKLPNWAESEEFILGLQDGRVSPSENIEVDSPALSWTDDTPQSGVKMDSIQSEGAPDMLLIFDCLRKIDTHKFAPLFSKWSGLQENETYKRVIKRHMDLCKVRTQVEEGKYSGAVDFFRDMLLIFNNALVFFSKDSQEYGAAYVLREFVIREMDKSLQREAASLSSSKSTESRTLDNMLSASTDAITLEQKKDMAEPLLNDPDAAAHMAHVNGEADGPREADSGSGQSRTIDRGGELKNVHEAKDVDGGSSSKIISKTFMRGKNRVKIQANKVNTQNEASELKKRESSERMVPTTGTGVRVITKNEALVPKQYAKKDASVSHDVRKSLLKSKEQVKDLDKRRSTRHLTGGRQAVTLPDGKKQSAAVVDGRRAVAHQEGKKRSTGALDGRQTAAPQEEKKRSTAARSSRSGLSGRIVSKGKQMSCRPQKRGRT